MYWFLDHLKGVACIQEKRNYGIVFKGVKDYYFLVISTLINAHKYLFKNLISYLSSSLNAVK